MELDHRKAEILRKETDISLGKTQSRMTEVLPGIFNMQPPGPASHCTGCAMSKSA